MRLILAVVLAGLQTAAGFGQQPFQETKSAKPITRIEGKVCSAAGEGIADAQVWLVNEVEKKIADAHTGEDGKFAITVPKQPAKYWLEVRKEGFAPVRMESADLAIKESQLKITMQKLQETSADSERLKANKTPEYSDETNFTIAGVTDSSQAGVHGSTTSARTSQTLAKETLALKSSSPESATSVSEAKSHRLLGDAKEESGDPVGAVQEYETTVKLEPSEENYFGWGAELLLHRAGVAAVEVFQKGVAAHAKSARMMAGLGAAHFAVGQYAEAAERMCEAADLNPQETAPYLFLGRMEKAEAELPACSAARLERFASEQPQNALANESFGLALWKKGRREQSSAEIQRAERYFKKAIAIDPSLADVYVQLGMLYKARGENGAALAAFEKAVAASPKSSDAHYQLSLAFRRGGEIAKAKQETKTCEELRRTEDAEMEKERRELRQFVTILKDGARAPE